MILEKQCSYSYSQASPEFEKLRAIRASVGGVGGIGGMLTWVAC